MLTTSSTADHSQCKTSLQPMKTRILSIILTCAALASCASKPRAMEQAIADSIPSMFAAPQSAPQQSPAFNAFFQGGAQ